MFRVKLRNYLARKLRVPEIPFALERLYAVGFHPTQIFDVGAYRSSALASGFYLCATQQPTSF